MFIYLKIYMLFRIFFSFFLSFFLSTPVAYGISQARDWIQVSDATYAAAAAMPDPLTHCIQPGLNPLPRSDMNGYCQILNPLHHDRNSISVFVGRLSKHFYPQIVTLENRVTNGYCVCFGIRGTFQYVRKNLSWNSRAVKLYPRVNQDFLQDFLHSMVLYQRCLSWLLSKINNISTSPS